MCCSSWKTNCYWVISNISSHNFHTRKNGLHRDMLRKIYKEYARVKENKYNSRFVDIYHQDQLNFKYAVQYESKAEGEN